MQLEVFWCTSLHPLIMQSSSPTTHIPHCWRNEGFFGIPLLNLRSGLRSAFAWKNSSGYPKQCSASCKKSAEDHCHCSQLRARRSSCSTHHIPLRAPQSRLSRGVGPGSLLWLTKHHKSQRTRFLAAYRGGVREGTERALVLNSSE